VLPVVLILYCWLSGWGKKWSFNNRTVFLFSLLVTGFYYVYQFAFGSLVLQFTYYVCYLAPALFLMLGLLYEALWKQPEPAGRKLKLVGLPLLAVSFLFPWVLHASGIRVFAWLRLWHYLVLAGVTGAMVVACAKTEVAGRRKLTMQVLATLLVGLTFNASFAAPIYSSMVKPYGSHDSTEMDVYRVALQLIKAIPPVSERPGKLEFWYGDRVETDTIDSVQSVYLWGGFSRCIPVPRQPDDNGMPHIGPFERKVFKDTKYLALLGEKEGDVQAGVAALSAEGFPFRLLEARVLSSGSYRMYLQLVELMHGDSTEAGSR
jgi:hypothetical protein